MVTDAEILARMLFKLINNKCYSKGHILEERLISAVAKHDRGRAKDILKQAIKIRLILIYGQTNYGLAYQLNTEKLSYVIDFIKKNYSKSDSLKYN